MQERAQRTKQRLLDATMQLISEKGTAETTFDAISELSGVSRGSIRFHFGSKSGLLFAAVDRVFDTWENEVLVPLIDDQAESTFQAAIQANRRFVQENREAGRLYFILMFDALGAQPEMLERFVQLHRRFRAFARQWIEIAQQNGAVSRSVDPEAASGVILGSLVGIHCQWQLDPEGIDLDTVYSTLTTVLDRGFEESDT